MNKCIETIKHRPVRDLAWALLRPCLFQQIPNMNDTWLSGDWVDKDTLPWLLTLDQSPQALVEHLKQQRATRLGVYFEQLLSFYFLHYPRFRLVANNLQANNQQRTIGEYDFIVYDHDDKQHYHFEVAIKFYIHLPTLDVDIVGNTPTYNWHHWVGPNKKDSLAIKMNHLINHQLVLKNTDAGAQALSSIHLTPEELSVRLLLAGRLYSSAEHVNGSTDLPTHLHPDFNEQQYWLSREHFINGKTVFADTQSDSDQYCILPRQQWMSPLTHDDIKTFSLECLTLSQLQQQLIADSHNQQPIHIAQFSLSDHQWQEKQRFFIID